MPHCSPAVKEKILSRLRSEVEKKSSPSLVPKPDYLDFLKKTTPSHWTIDAPHIRLISEHLDAVDRGEIDRLAIHMPPRHAKTETVTVRYGVYSLLRNPSENVLITGYNAHFAKRLGRKARTIATQVMEIDPEKTAADEWATKSGGVLMTRGVGSPPTGVGFRRIIIDDPIRKREDADSETYREKAWDWYTDDLYTRLEPDGAIVLIMTLWHEDDIGARVTSSEPGRWTVLKLPALAETNDPLGRAEGDPLWPDRFSISDLKRIQDVMEQNEGSRSWNALYQQRPSAKEGDFFKVSQLTIDEAPPQIIRSCRAWDIASSAGSGDYTAGVKIGVDGNGRFWILDVVRGQWGTDERNSILLSTAHSDGKSTKIHVPQDPGAAGKDLALYITRLLQGFNVVVDSVSGSKESRADPFSSQVNGANVNLVKGTWNRHYIEELRGFPGGKHDDQVDASSDAFTQLVTMGQSKVTFNGRIM